MLPAPRNPGGPLLGRWLHGEVFIPVWLHQSCVTLFTQQDLLSFPTVMPCEVLCISSVLGMSHGQTALPSFS